MEGGVSLALLASLLLVIAISHASPNTCGLVQHVVQEGEAQAVYKSVSKKKRESESFSSYLLPGRDFSGVSLAVAGNRDANYSRVAYFPLDECYLDVTNWLHLNVTVFVEKVKRSSNFLHVLVAASGCQLSCKSSYGKNKFTALTVMSFGSSVWVCDKPPDECLAEGSSNHTQPGESTSGPPECRIPPAALTNGTTASSLDPPSTPTMPPNVTAAFCPSPQGVTASTAPSPSPSPGLIFGLPTGTLAAVVGGVVVVVLAVVVVVVCCVCRRRRTTHRSFWLSSRTRAESKYY